MSFIQAKSCNGKVSYRTLRDAKKASDALNRRISGNGNRSQPYPCAECQGFHLGRDHRKGRRP